jgi:activator of HSP90 ATPase
MNTKFSRITGFITTVLLLQLSALAQDKQDTMSAHPNTAVSPNSATIHMEVDFNASPERLYEALLDSKQFCEFTAQSKMFSAKSATIDSTEGGAFSLFDGRITGRNVELIPNKLIVQAWRVANWPEGVYSIAKFEFKPQGSGTHLVFDHTGFPEEMHDHLLAGWQSNYWDPLAKYLH